LTHNLNRAIHEGKEGKAVATTSTRADVYYPESDGEPMGETIQHRDANIDLILALQDWFVDDPLAYVSGDEFLYYVEGRPRFVVSPDVWCVRGIDKTIPRPIYKTWQEGGKGPEFVVELTSPSTRHVDLGKKFRIYQDDLKVLEYFLFDPLDEYLDPVLQGYRLVDGEYRRIEPEAGRLPSEVLGLHLEADGILLRLFDPATGQRLLNRLERLEREKAARRESDAKLKTTRARLRRKDVALQEKDAALQEKDAALLESQGETERLRREIEALRAAQKPKPKRK
jgi:Uma2 family endonuclease